ncbi:hypothetical protein [Halanaerobium congolense]|uniref:Uncharacterized protein n=1 Tax=Halanaerobium congolense TaxID=54121 RepID=A0A1G6S7A5_9FIRM|nr:hypothetical protein [Halanaerobium congolense]SDD12748.1 hypothetical protein SAMN04488597_1282 [Halanaerobium congolense]SHN09689.1 hypothetical protein SAMN04515650_12213 [Halanaerobium congolense]
MEIVVDVEADYIGSIFLQAAVDESKENYAGEREIKRCSIINDDSIYLKLNKINWPDKTYYQAIKDEIFTEEFYNEADEYGYIYDMELFFEDGKLDKIIDNYKIVSFDFNKYNFYGVFLDQEKEIFNENSYVYPFTEKKEAYAIVNIPKGQDCTRTVIDLRKEKGKRKRIEEVPPTGYLKGIIFKEECVSYDINSFKKLAIYRVK